MWTAEFADGPLKDAPIDWIFAGRFLDECWFIERPGESMPEARWLLVGFAPGFEPEPDHPWAGGVHYALDRERSQLEHPEGWQPGDDEGHAVYRQVIT